MPSEFTLPTGDVLLVGQQIGDGMWQSSVYRASHPRFGEVILKLVPVTYARSERARQAGYMKREMEYATRLRHPNVREVYLFGELPPTESFSMAEGGYYFLAKWFPCTLSDALREGSRSWTFVATLAASLADALEYVHSEDIVHRDLKPSNILLDQVDDGHATLMDFGIARHPDATQLTTARQNGTLAYMAPEQVRDSSDVTSATDQYALTLILWEVLTGSLPRKETAEGITSYALRFEGLPPLVVGGERRENLEGVFARALATEPPERFGSVDEFVAEFLDAGLGDGLGAKPTTVLEARLDDRRSQGGALWIYGSLELEDPLHAASCGARWEYVPKRGGWYTASESLRESQLLTALRARDVVVTPAGLVAGPVSRRPVRKEANGRFMRPMKPSDELAVIVGKHPLPRTEITKKLWSYIKRHGLQDEKNRRQINADASLLPVFGGKRSVSMLEMTKIVNRHLS